MVTGLSPMDELDAVVRAVSSPGAGRRRTVHHAGDRLSVARRAARRARRTAGHRRRRVQAADDRQICATCSARSAARSVKSPITQRRLPNRPDDPVHLMQSAVVQYALAAARGGAARHRRPGDRRRRRAAARRRRVGLRLRRAPGAQHAFVGRQRAGRARARVRRHHRESRPRRARLSRRRSRRQRDGRGDVRRRACSAGPGATTSARRARDSATAIDGAMAAYVQGARPLPASRFPTRCRSNWRASPSRTPSPTTRCASTRRSARAISSSCSGPGRSACSARAWRRSPAPIRSSSLG